MATLRAQQLYFSYPSGFAVGELDLTVEVGSFLALIGPNGSGKSTLLRLLSGLLAPQSGQVFLDEVPIADYSSRKLALKMAVIPSENYFEFPFQVREVVEMGRFPHHGRLQRLSPEDRKQISEVMELTQISSLSGRSISEISSGERQRVLLARAIAQRPEILVLDEPNAHLDIHHQISIFRLLKQLNRSENLTVIVVLHDLTTAAVFCDTVALLSRGMLVRRGLPSEVITTQTIRDIYGADVEVHSGPGGVPLVTYSA